MPNFKSLFFSVGWVGWGGDIIFLFEDFCIQFSLNEVGNLYQCICTIITDSVNPNFFLISFFLRRFSPHIRRHQLSHLLLLLLRFLLFLLRPLVDEPRLPPISLSRDASSHGNPDETRDKPQLLLDRGGPARPRDGAREDSLPRGKRRQ